MLKKTLFVLSLLFVLVATPAFAHQSNKSKDGEHEAEGSCAESAEWKNHGEFVSCTAKTQPGGFSVSISAKSDIGKNDHDRDDDEDEIEDDDEDDDNGGVLASPSPTPSGSPSPSASPSPSPSASPEVSPGPSVSPSPSASPSVVPLLTNVNVKIKANGPVDEVVAFIGQVLVFLQNLVS